MKPYAAGLLVGATLTALMWSGSSRFEAHAVPNVRDANELSDVFRRVAADAMPSIVSIETVTRSRAVEMRGSDDELAPFREFFRDDPRFEQFFRSPSQRRGIMPRRQGAGSGFIIDASGIIMTNNHVVAGADEVRVRLADGREFLAKEVKTDPRTDVAIVRIEGAGSLKALRLGDSRAVQVGDWVLAFGTPFGLEMTVTQGIISGKGRSRQIADREDFLQTDAAINPGNSGGPLVNLRGEVIGINTAIASASGGYDGIGFAVPTHIAGWVGDQLIRNGQVRRGYLGTNISPVDAETAKQFNVAVRDGAIVRAVMPNAPAEKAGLEPGDVILKLNNLAVSDPTTLQGIVEQLEIGKSYPLEIIREGKRSTLSVTIEEMPAELSTRAGNKRSSDGPTPAFNDLGLRLKPLTKELGQQLGIAAQSGLAVVGVQSESLAERAGVKVGDLIERVGTTPVTTEDDFRKAVSSLNSKEGIVLHLRNAEGKRFVVLRSE